MYNHSQTVSTSIVDHTHVKMHSNANAASPQPPQQVVVDADVVVAEEDRRRALFRAAGSCCYCVVVVLFIFFLLAAPDLAVLLLFIIFGVFFGALIVTQIRVRREAYLRAVQAAQQQRNRTGGQGTADEYPPGTVRVGGFAYDAQRGDIVPIMVIPENSNQPNRPNAGDNSVRTPGVAIYQAPPSSQATPQQPAKQESDTVCQDGDRVYGRARYLSGASSNVALSLKPDYEEVTAQEAAAADASGRKATTAPSLPASLPRTPQTPQAGREGAVPTIPPPQYPASASHHAAASQGSSPVASPSSLSARPEAPAAPQVSQPRERSSVLLSETTASSSARRVDNESAESEATHVVVEGATKPHRPCSP